MARDILVSCPHHVTSTRMIMLITERKVFSSVGTDERLLLLLNILKRCHGLYVQKQYYIYYDIYSTQKVLHTWAFAAIFSLLLGTQTKVDYHMKI